MKIFRDATGREWPVVANFSTLRRVKDLAGVDLLDNDGLESVTRSASRVVDVLFAMVQATAIERNISDDAFGEILVDCYDAAQTALFEELASFFRRLNRTPMAVLLETMLRFQATESDTKTLAEKIDQAFRATAERERARAIAALDGLIAGETSTD
jgi:hypothetical protein